MTETRKLWGIVMTGSLRETSDLLGQSCFQRIFEPRYTGEPSGPMLFTTRTSARTFAAERNTFYRTNYDEGHICHEWRFQVVRVERVLKALASRGKAR